MGCPFHRKFPSAWQVIRQWISFSLTRKSALSVANLQAILDTTVDAIVTIDEHAKILAFNKAAEKMFGYPAREVFGKNVSLLMPEPFHSQHDQYVQHYLDTGIKKIIGIGREVVGQRKGGAVFAIDIAVSEVFTGSKRLFTAIIREITAQKKALEEAAANIRMTAELKAKNEFISILGHELRTLLCAIHGALGLLVAENEQSIKTQELCSIAYRASTRLIGIVNDLLDISKIEAGKLIVTLRPTSITTVVREAVAIAKAMMQNMGITLVADIPSSDLLVLGDESRLLQVMQNLLSNAAKFSPPQGQIVVSLQEIDGKARICVCDQGCGIPAEYHEKIFTPFFQVPHPDTRAVGGTGLGLHLCRSILEQLHGNIAFTTETNQGATFYFELPIYQGTI